MKQKQQNKKSHSRSKKAVAPLKKGPSFKKARQPKTKLVLGRKEKIDLPELGLYDLDAKVDTGAYTSSIHCHHIEIVEKKLEEILTFDLLDPKHPQYEKKIFRFKEYQEKTIKNSFGKSERRYIIRTILKIYDQEFVTEFSLSNRSDLKNPVLLGRKFIKQGFVVDVSKKDLSKKTNKDPKTKKFVIQTNKEIK